MRDFIITTDSNSDLPIHYIEENKIGVIPHYYELDGKLYGEEEELPPKEFYDSMRAGKMPTTMASNPAVIYETFEAYAREGVDVLHISFSSALSGGYSNVAVGAREVCEKYKDANIIVIDTLNVSLGQGLIIMKAIEMKESGKSIEEAAEWIEQNKLNFCVQFTVDDLHHLHRGGRVSKATAVLGTMIHVKPVLYVNDLGELVSLTTVRGRKKSLNTLVRNVEERIGKYEKEADRIAVVHGDVLEDAKYLIHLLQERFPHKKIICNTVSPSIGAHSGPGAVGICFIGERRL